MSNLQNKVRCDSCGKVQMEIRYSESALRKYRESLTRNQRNPKNPVKLPRCLNCNPQNRNEMQCVMCETVKPLDDFAKAQRRKTDTAHCLDCQQEKEDREPDFEDEVEEVKIIDEIKKMEISSRSGYAPSGASRLPSARASRLSRTQSDREETETNPSTESWANGNDELSLISDQTGSTQSTRVVTGTHWDDFQGGNRVRPTRGSSSGFVKQNAVPAKTLKEKAEAQLVREKAILNAKEEKLERADSDEDDDSDENPY